MKIMELFRFFFQKKTKGEGRYCYQFTVNNSPLRIMADNMQKATDKLIDKYFTDNNTVVSKVTTKCVYQLNIGDYIKTPQGEEQITEISIDKNDNRVLNITTKYGKYQAIVGSIVTP